jgi:hypothetical protein
MKIKRNNANNKNKKKVLKEQSTTQLCHIQSKIKIYKIEKEDLKTDRMWLRKRDLDLEELKVFFFSHFFSDVGSERFFSLLEKRNG